MSRIGHGRKGAESVEGWRRVGQSCLSQFLSQFNSVAQDNVSLKIEGAIPDIYWQIVCFDVMTTVNWSVIFTYSSDPVSLSVIGDRANGIAGAFLCCCCCCSFPPSSLARVPYVRWKRNQSQSDAANAAPVQWARADEWIYYPCHAQSYHSCQMLHSIVWVALRVKLRQSMDWRVVGPNHNSLRNRSQSKIVIVWCRKPS